MGRRAGQLSAVSFGIHAKDHSAWCGSTRRALRMVQRAITVQLVGGLGNQLFGYHAGAALAAHHGIPLRLDTAVTRHGMMDHGIEILRFDLPGNRLPDSRIHSRLIPPGSLKRRAIDKLIREITAVGRPLRIYQESNVGEDPQLFDQPPGTHLRGYFQSWRIVERAVHDGYPRRPALFNPSPWLGVIAQRCKDESPIAVHVRRGDYSLAGIFESLVTD